MIRFSILLHIILLSLNLFAQNTKPIQYTELDSIGKARVDSIFFSQIPYSSEKAKADIQNNNIQVVILHPWGSPSYSQEEFEQVEERFGFHFIFNYFNVPNRYREEAETTYNSVIFSYLDSINGFDTELAIHTELARIYYERQIYSFKCDKDLWKVIRKKCRGEKKDTKKQIFQADQLYRDREFGAALHCYNSISEQKVKPQTFSYLMNSRYHCLLNLKRFEEADRLRNEYPKINQALKS